jgi:hypothetical protein
VDQLVGAAPDRLLPRPAQELLGSAVHVAEVAGLADGEQGLAHALGYRAQMVVGCLQVAPGMDLLGQVDRDADEAGGIAPLGVVERAADQGRKGCAVLAAHVQLPLPPAVAPEGLHDLGHLIGVLESEQLGHRQIAHSLLPAPTEHLLGPGAPLDDRSVRIAGDHRGIHGIEQLRLQADLLEGSLALRDVPCREQPTTAVGVAATDKPVSTSVRPPHLGLDVGEPPIARSGQLHRPRDLRTILGIEQMPPVATDQLVGRTPEDLPPSMVRADKAAVFEDRTGIACHLEEEVTVVGQVPCRISRVHAELIGLLLRRP